MLECAYRATIRKTTKNCCLGFTQEAKESHDHFKEFQGHFPKIN